MVGLPGIRGIRHKSLRLFRIFDRKITVEHFHDALDRNRCPRQHDRNHRNHQKRHDNLHAVLDERHHVANLQRSHINLMTANPDDQNADAIHHQHHHRHQ